LENTHVLIQKYLAFISSGATVLARLQVAPGVSFTLQGVTVRARL